MKRLLICVVVIIILHPLSFILQNTCLGDAVFIHDYQIKEYMLGDKEAQVTISYTEHSMMRDKRTRYTGNWMKRIFGTVKEGRETARFLLDKNQIREIDWSREKIRVLPFEKLTDTSWIKAHDETRKQVDEILKARYRVAEPVFSIRHFPEKKMIRGYPCQQIRADLRLETADLKKKAASITLINQQLWVSESVPGFDEYRRFHTNLSEKLGLDAARLGNLSFLLQYWQGSLDPIRDSLNKIMGYPVKNILTVDGQYIKGTASDSPEILKFQVKKESMELRKVDLNRSEDARFKEPADFKVIIK